MRCHLAASRLPNLSAWLQKHGRQLEELFVADSYPRSTTGCLQLPCVLVNSCPDLRELDLQHMLQSGDSSPLLALTTQCTSLSLGGRAIDDGSAGVLCQLTHLRHLWLDDSPTLTDTGLEQLTALTGLDDLVVEGRTRLSSQVLGPNGEEGEWAELSFRRCFGVSCNVRGGCGAVMDG